MLSIFVDDVDASYAKAVEAGARPAIPPTTGFWGDRFGWVADAFGHTWQLSTILEELTPEEAAARMRAFVAETGGFGKSVARLRRLGHLLLTGALVGGIGACAHAAK